MTPCPKCGKKAGHMARGKWSLCRRCARDLQNEIALLYLRPTMKAIAHVLHIEHKTAWYHFGQWRKRVGFFASILALCMIACEHRQTAHKPPPPAPTPKHLILPEEAAPPRPVPFGVRWFCADTNVHVFKLTHGPVPSALTNLAWSTNSFSNVIVSQSRPWFVQVYSFSNGILSDPSDRLLRFPPTNLLFVASARSNLTCSATVKGPWKTTNSPLALLSPKNQQFFRGYGASNYIERW